MEEISGEPCILECVPIPEVPTLEIRQRGLPEATLHPRVLAGGPGWSFLRSRDSGWGRSAEGSKGTLGVPRPWAGCRWAAAHTQAGRAGQTGKRTPLGQPRYLKVPGAVNLLPSATYLRQPRASAFKGAIPDFRRPRDVSKRRWPPGRLPAEVQVALGARACGSCPASSRVPPVICLDGSGMRPTSGRSNFPANSYKKTVVSLVRARTAAL